MDVVYEEGSEGVRHFGGEGGFVGRETTPRLSNRTADAKVKF